MSDPVPDRFHEARWTCLEVVGWIVDRDPTLFGRINSPEDLERALFRERVMYPPLHESPGLAIARAVREGKIAAYKNGSLLTPADCNGADLDDEIQVNREHVLRLWPDLNWLPLPNAVGMIMRHRDIGIDEAQRQLIEACLLGEAMARTPDFEIPPTWWRKARINADALYSLSIDQERPAEYRTGGEHELQEVEVNANELRRWLGDRIDATPDPSATPVAVAASHKRPSPTAAMKSAQEYFDGEIAARRIPSIAVLDKWVVANKIPYRGDVRQCLRRLMAEKGIPLQRGRSKKDRAKAEPKPKLTGAERHKRFVEMAHEVEEDESLEAFDWNP